MDRKKTLALALAALMTVSSSGITNVFAEDVEENVPDSAENAVVETVPEEEAPTEEETPAEEAPAEEEAKAEEEIPAEEEAKAEEETPNEEEPEAEEEAPIKETPAEEETEEEVELYEEGDGTKENPYSFEQFNALKEVKGEVWVDIGDLDISETSATLGNYTMADELIASNDALEGYEPNGNTVSDGNGGQLKVQVQTKEAAKIHVVGSVTAKDNNSDYNKNFTQFDTLYVVVPHKSTVIFDKVEFNGIFNINANYIYCYNRPDGTEARGESYYTNRWYFNPVAIENIVLDGCTVNGQWFSNGTPAKNVTIKKTAFTHHPDTGYANNANPIWWKNVKDIESVTIENSTVISSRPIKFEGYSGSITVANNTFNMLDGNACGTTGESDAKKNAALYLGTGTADDGTTVKAGDIVVTGNKLVTEEGVHTQLIAYKGTVLKDGAELLVKGNTDANDNALSNTAVINGWHSDSAEWSAEVENFVSANASEDGDLPHWRGEAGTTVMVGDAYYTTLEAALKAVYVGGPYETPVDIICKENANLGRMAPHTHIADSINIIGNGATVKGDLEIDTYKYARGKYAQDANGDYLTKDITVNVEGLNGIAAWGERHTDKVVTLNFKDCKNMGEVYFTGKPEVNGTINITLDGCSFNAANGSNANSSVYTNNPGTISITDCEFDGIAVPVNLNNKSNGKQTVTVKNATFTDCATKALAAAQNASKYAAPIRFVTQNGATTEANVEACTITYSESVETNGFGDILLGDGREGKESTLKASVTVKGMDAEVQVQYPGVSEATVTTTVSAGEEKTVTMPESAVITMSDFVAAVRAGNGAFDGEGKTVVVKPRSNCDGYDNRTDIAAQTEADVRRVNSDLAQYQLFGTDFGVALGNINISNVNFKFVPADFEICVNSGWKGTFTAEKVKVGQFHLYNTGNVNFTNCTFDAVVLSPWTKTEQSVTSERTTTITGCTFKNAYDSYAIKDVQTNNVMISGNTFDSCGGGIMFSGAKVADVSVTGNTFRIIDSETSAKEGKAGTRGLIQIAANVATAEGGSFTVTGNTADNGAPVFRFLSKNAALDAFKVSNEGFTDNTLTTPDSIGIAQKGDKLVACDIINADTGVTYSTLADAIAAAEAGQTIKLCANATLDEAVTIDKNLTLDLGGKTLAVSPVTISGTADVTVKNGKITRHSGETAFSVNDSAKFTVDGVKMDLSQTDGITGNNCGMTGIFYFSSGSLTVKDSTIESSVKVTSATTYTANATAAYGIKLYGETTGAYGYRECSGTVTIENSVIKGGSIVTDEVWDSYSTTRYLMHNGGIGLGLYGSPVVTITDSEIYGGNSDYKDAGDAILVGSSFGNKLTINSAKVVGGSSVKGAESGYGYGGEGINSTSQNAGISVAIEGSKIAGGDGGKSWNGNGIEISHDIPFEIKDTTVAAGDGASASGNASAIRVGNYDLTKATLENVTLDAGDNAKNSVIKNAGSSDIKLKGTLTVEGGKALENANFAVAEEDAKDVKLVGSVDTTTVKVDGYVLSESTTAEDTLVIEKALVAIGDKNYATLKDAFAAAKKGDTVKLLGDVTVTETVNVIDSSVLSDITLDGNNFTITYDTPDKNIFRFGDTTSGKQTYATGVKVKDVTMSGNARYAFFLHGGTTSQFTNVNISGKYFIAINLYGTHGATFTNCNITNEATVEEGSYLVPNNAVWSNVAAANPVKLINSKISKISINAYTTANVLAPKIFVDKDSEVAVATLDDGAISGDKLLCVSAESEGKFTVREILDDTENEGKYIESEAIEAVAVIERGGKKTVLCEKLTGAVNLSEDGDTIAVLANAAAPAALDKRTVWEKQGKDYVQVEKAINGLTIKAADAVTLSDDTTAVPTVEITGLEKIAGTNVTLENLYIVPSKTLEIAGEGATLKGCYVRAKNTAYADEVVNKNLNNYLTKLTGKNVKIENCVFDGMGAEGDTQYLPNIKLLPPTNCENVTVTGTTFKNARSAMYPGAASGEFTIDGCKFENIDTYSIHLGSGGANLTVKNSELMGWTSFGTPTGTITFENCAFSASKLCANIVAHNNAAFTNCTFTKEFTEQYYTDEDNYYLGLQLDQPNLKVIVNGAKIVDENGDEITNIPVTKLTDRTKTGDVVAFDAETNAEGKFTSGTFVGDKDAITAAAQEGLKATTNPDGTKSYVLKVAPKEGMAFYVDKVSGEANYFATLPEAVAAAQSGATITMTENANGDGVVVPSGKDLTFDFDGHVYEVTGTLVGSGGSETNGFQLLENSTIVMKNGKIFVNPTTAQWGPNTVNSYGLTGARMIIQNYANLTLENMILDGNRTATGKQINPMYVLSNNNGDIVLTGSTTIIAAPVARPYTPYTYAFDVCSYSTYPHVTVTLDENMTGTIYGNIQISTDKPASNNKSNFNLTIKNGVINGKIDKASNVYEGFGDITGGMFTDSKVDEKLVLEEGKKLATVMVGGVEYNAVVTDFTVKAEVSGDDRKTETADMLDVYVDEIVTVNVVANGGAFTNADWVLKYDPTKFAPVGDPVFANGYEAVTSSDGYTLAGKVRGAGSADEYADGTVLATYTFKALAQTETVTGEFIVTSAHVNDYAMAAVVDSVPAALVSAKATILAGEDATEIAITMEDTTAEYTGEKIYGNKASSTTVDASGNTPAFTYSTEENGTYTTELPGFTAVGEYTYWVKAELDGFKPTKASAKVTITEATVTASVEYSINNIAGEKLYITPMINRLLDGEFTGSVKITVTGGGLNETRTFAKADFGTVVSNGTVTANDKIEVTLPKKATYTITAVYVEGENDNYKPGAKTTVKVNAAKATVSDLTAVKEAIDESNTYVYDGNAHSIDLDTAKAKLPTDGDWTVSVTPDTANSITEVGKNFVTIIFTDANDKYNDVTINTVLEVTPRPVTIKVNDFVKDFGKPDPAELTNSTGYTIELTQPATATGEALVEAGDLGTITLVREPGEAKKTYKVTASYTPNRNYEVTVVDGKLEIGKPAFKVEVVDNALLKGGDVKADYVAGYRLVLVYTDVDNAFFNYGGANMFDVTARGYKYVDYNYTENTATESTEAYKHVYGLVVPSIGRYEATAEYHDRYKSRVGYSFDMVDKPEKVVYDNDINLSEFLDVNDYSMTNGIYNVIFNSSRFAKNFLKADVNGDKMVDSTDAGEVKTAVDR